MFPEEMAVVSLAQATQEFEYAREVMRQEEERKQISRVC